MTMTSVNHLSSSTAASSDAFGAGLRHHDVSSPFYAFFSLLYTVIGYFSNYRNTHAAEESILEEPASDGIHHTAQDEMLPTTSTTESSQDGTLSTVWIHKILPPKQETIFSLKDAAQSPSVDYLPHHYNSLLSASPPPDSYFHHFITSDSTEKQKNTTVPPCKYLVPAFEDYRVTEITSAFVFTTFLWHTLFMIALSLRHFFAQSRPVRSENSFTESTPLRRTGVLNQSSTSHSQSAPSSTSHFSLFSWLTDTKTHLYFSLASFSTLRMLYFGIKMFEPFIGNNSIAKDDLNGIALALYHWSSTWFYTAFMILALNWAEEYLLSAGLSPYLVSTFSYKPKWKLAIFNVFIHSIELIIIIINLVFDFNDSVYGSNVMNLIQLLYHAILCFCVVIVFLLWIAFAKQNRTEMLNFESRPSYRQLFFTALIVSFIIILKGVVNVIYGIVRAVALLTNVPGDGQVCGGTDLMVVSVGALVLDLIPVAIVVFLWKSPSTEETSEGNQSDVRVFSQLNDSVERTPTAPIVARRRYEGNFSYSQ